MPRGVHRVANTVGGGRAGADQCGGRARRERPVDRRLVRDHERRRASPATRVCCAMTHVMAGLLTEPPLPGAIRRWWTRDAPAPPRHARHPRARGPRGRRGCRPAGRAPAAAPVLPENAPYRATDRVRRQTMPRSSDTKIRSFGMIRPPPRETEVTLLHHDRSAPHAALPASADGQRLVQQARVQTTNVPAVFSQPHDTHVVHADESRLLDRVAEDGRAQTARQAETLLGPVEAGTHVRRRWVPGVSQGGRRRGAQRAAVARFSMSRTMSAGEGSAAISSRMARAALHRESSFRRVSSRSPSTTWGSARRAKP
jgi:hypothetical protein